MSRKKTNRVRVRVVHYYMFAKLLPFHPFNSIALPKYLLIQWNDWSCQWAKYSPIFLFKFTKYTRTPAFALQNLTCHFIYCYRPIWNLVQLWAIDLIFCIMMILIILFFVFYELQEKNHTNALYAERRSVNRAI